MKKELEAFVEGQLCYVVLRPYQGEGEPVLILHEANVADLGGGFYYGNGRTWVLQPHVSIYDEQAATLYEGNSDDSPV
jgi:hypothetical protein